MVFPNGAHAFEENFVTKVKQRYYIKLNRRRNKSQYFLIILNFITLVPCICPRRSRGLVTLLILILLDCELLKSGDFRNNENGKLVLPKSLFSLGNAYSGCSRWLIITVKYCSTPELQAATGAGRWRERCGWWISLMGSGERWRHDSHSLERYHYRTSKGELIT